MEFTAYVCDDFTLTKSRELIIYGNHAEFKSNNREMIQNFISNSFYNAVVCPTTYTDEFGVQPNKIIFK